MIRIYNEKEIEVMREGGGILARIMKQLKREVRVGIATNYLDKVAEDLIFQYGAESSFKGFNNYPAILCTSINEEIVHGVPGERKIKQGDILSLDLGIRYPAPARPASRSEAGEQARYKAGKSYCTDTAMTVPVGKVNKEARKLIEITEKALEIGIKQCKIGNHLGDIGWAIQNYVEKNGFNVVRELCGHGVGREVHEDPQILNYGKKGTGPELVEGMVLALEPMVVIGGWQVEKTKEGFCYKTKDNSLSAHFEHTIATTKNGPITLTEI